MYSLHRDVRETLVFKGGFFPPASCLVTNEMEAGCFFVGEENKSLSHNNNPLSSKTGLAVSQTFMFLQS